MRSNAWMAAAGALALMTAGQQASACEAPCRYGRAYYVPPPVVVYEAPPVYAYSYFGPGYAYPGYHGSYYVTRVNIFPGPAWTYSAAYYTSRAGGCRRARVHRPCHVRRGAYRPALMYGPIIRASHRR